MRLFLQKFSKKSCWILHIDCKSGKVWCGLSDTRELLPCSEVGSQAFPLLSWHIMPILVEGRLRCSLNLLKMCVQDEEVVLGEMCVIHSEYWVQEAQCLLEPSQLSWGWVSAEECNVSVLWTTGLAQENFMESTLKGQCQSYTLPFLSSCCWWLFREINFAVSFGLLEVSLYSSRIAK